VYSPKIKPELIPQLYAIGKQSSKPMTKVVHSMIREGIRRCQHEKERSQNSEDNPVNSPASPERSPGV